MSSSSTLFHDRVNAILLRELGDAVSRDSFELVALCTTHHAVAIVSTRASVGTLHVPLDALQRTLDDPTALSALVAQHLLPLLRGSVPVPVPVPAVTLPEDVRERDQRPLAVPFGSRDLHPDFSAARPGALFEPVQPAGGFLMGPGGGGMLVGPGAFRQPPARRFPGAGGAIVPGARYDPIGPNDPNGAFGGRAGRRAPAPGERPPGFEDEHQLGGGSYNDMFL
jgi:hypothetical protein